MEATFGSEAEPITTREQLESAFQTLYTFRAQHGVESPAAIDEPPVYEDHIFDGCSATTQTQGRIYVKYVEKYCCDVRVLNFYPLLDELSRWVETRA